MGFAAGHGATQDLKMPELDDPDLATFKPAGDEAGNRGEVPAEAATAAPEEDAAGSGTAEPGTAGPGTAGPGTAEPGTAEPGTAGPGLVEPPDDRPSTGSEQPSDPPSNSGESQTDSSGS
jgi:hypothetical protein